jgi:hypothetical protein
MDDDNEDTYGDEGDEAVPAPKKRRSANGTGAAAPKQRRNPHADAAADMSDDDDGGGFEEEHKSASRKKRSAAVAPRKRGLAAAAAAAAAAASAAAAAASAADGESLLNDPAWATTNGDGGAAGGNMAMNLEDAHQFAAGGARLPVRSSDTNKVAQCGILKRMTLKNFLNHRHFDIQFNPNVNFISGANGGQMQRADREEVRVWFESI